jgi:pyruvate dehydrogenase E2 component (dihydrolipoamide acetyltransferase)
VRKDVEAVVSAGPAGPTTPSGSATLAGLAVDRIPLSRTRKVIAERLSSPCSRSSLLLKAVIPADNLVRSREATAEKTGRKISLNALLMKLTAEALKKFPIVNASWQGDSIAVFRSIDIGLAVAQPDGLITPVVRTADPRGSCGSTRNSRGSSSERKPGSSFRMSTRTRLQHQ